MIPSEAAYPRLHIIQSVCQGDFEDCVGPAALFIHVGGSNCPRLVALGHQGLNILSGNRLQAQILLFVNKHDHSPTLSTQVFGGYILFFGKNTISPYCF